MTDPTVTVSKNLREIVDLSVQLLTQAVHDARAQVDGKSLPGGRAMIALASVGDLDTWTRRVDLAEADWYAARNRPGNEAGPRPEPLDEDDLDAPVLQTLRYWSERYRWPLGAVWDHIPTINSEAKFLRANLDWIRGNAAGDWVPFTRDIASARRTLENILAAGQRSERGVPCMYDECRGVRLVRKLVPARGEDGEKVWKLTPWHCPNCRREWDNDSYWRNVEAANERAQREDIDGEIWCSIDYAARDVKRSPKTIRTWINRDELATLCVITGRRSKWVNLEAVRDLDAKAATRSRSRAS